jgi:uncharacterized OB-fold protein
MSIGSILVGLALALVVAAYLARPFRAAYTADQVIETWVARVGNAADATMACPRCGRLAGPTDSFCAGCGAQLQEQAE